MWEEALWMFQKCCVLYLNEDLHDLLQAAHFISVGVGCRGFEPTILALHQSVAFTCSPFCPTPRSPFSPFRAPFRMPAGISPMVGQPLQGSPCDTEKQNFRKVSCKLSYNATYFTTRERFFILLANTGSPFHLWSRLLLVPPVQESQTQCVRRSL